MMKQTIMKSGLTYTLFKRMFTGGTLTSSLVLFAIATFLLGTIAFLYQLAVPFSAGVAGSH